MNVDALAALLPGPLAQRRALVLWRLYVDDPPPGRRTLAAALGMSLGSVINDERRALDYLCTLGDSPAMRAAVPPGSVLAMAVFEDRAAAHAAQKQALYRGRNERNRDRGPLSGGTGARLRSVTLHTIDPETLLRSEAAAFLRLGRTAFDTLVKAGAIPHYRVRPNGTRFFLLDDLRAFQRTKVAETMALLTDTDRSRRPDPTS